MNAIEISLSGLDVEWRRLEIIAQNLANMNTSRVDGGGAFQPLRLISGTDRSFSSTLLEGSRQPAPAGVRVLDIEAVADGMRQVHEPDHPHADADGFVTYPNVDHAAEMTLMIRTSRAYEANLTAVTIARQMYSRALEMGRNS